MAKVTARQAGAGGLAAAVVAAALSAAAPYGETMINKWENGGRGPILVPYRDLVNVMTVCSGATHVEMRVYTREECEKIDKAVYYEFGYAVLGCTPEIHDKPKVLASAIVLAVNIGKSGYCRSTAARRFKAGNIAAGCDAYLLWNRATFRAPQPGKQCIQRPNGLWSCVVKGLENRRRDERGLCLSGAANR